ncbi:jg21635 [Pararge aegeria aegeria]|uniref:Jg21635 protein n=1 Tax=Pararge aegeria aegeria TaxID=348720 RepID=A0A8S4RFB1_9NEOP|nr:jg21635 [Pararge aegeria aegeria]
MNQEGVLACCAVCNQQTHRRCGRCLNIYYCNTEHQRQDWKRHKSECAPKLQKQDERNDKVGDHSSHIADKLKIENEKEIIINALVNSDEKEVKPQKGSEVRRLKKSKNKSVKKEGSDIVSDKKTSQVAQNTDQSDSANQNKTNLKDKSVISSVVYTNKDLTKVSAITHEGSSEQEILSETAQQLSADFAEASTSNVLKAVDRSEVKMPSIPSEQPTRMKEYPEASLKGSAAPFNNIMNSYCMDPSDPCYGLCQRVIQDMTQYGVCVLNNFLGKERGLLVLNEVLEMHRSGIFTAGQLVSNPGSTEAQTIRSDRITWIDGKEPHCYHIGQLISQFEHLNVERNFVLLNWVSSSSFSGLVFVLGRPEPSAVRSATGTAPRWFTPVSRAHSRSLAGKPGRQVLQGVMLESPGMLHLARLLLYIGAIRVSVFNQSSCMLRTEDCRLYLK